MFANFSKCDLGLAVLSQSNSSVPQSSELCIFEQNNGFMHSVLDERAKQYYFPAGSSEKVQSQPASLGQVADIRQSNEVKMQDDDNNLPEADI